MNIKLLNIVFIIVILISLLISCSDGSNTLTPFEEMNYRMVAYNSLSDGDKSTITSDWEKAPVKKGSYHLMDENIHQLIFNQDEKLGFALKNNKSILVENQKLIAVIFHTNVDALLGPIIIIINAKSNEAIGYVLRL